MKLFGRYDHSRSTKKLHDSFSVHFEAQKTLHLAQVIAVAKIDIKNLTDKCSLSGRVSKMEVAKLFLCCKLSVVSYEFAL